MPMQRFVELFQAPGKKQKRKRSSRVRQFTPPEDLIEDSRRKEILLTFQTALESCKEGDSTPKGKLMPISCIKKPLKQLQLVRILCFRMPSTTPIEPLV